MKVLLGLGAGITASILAYLLWRPTIAWTFTHNQPATHPDCRPRYRTWHAGDVSEGPWT